MNSKAKGQRGHALTQEWLEKDGWIVYVCPHLQVEWRHDGTRSDPIWRQSGYNDAFAVPVEGTNKKRGGVDIIALRPKPDSILAEVKLVQVKKTAANPITPSMKEGLKLTAAYHKLRPEWVEIYWWPDGHGIQRGGPIMWNAAWELSAPGAELLTLGGNNGRS